MRFGGKWRALFMLLACACLPACGRNSADEPKPMPENTISIHLEEPVPPQKFDHPPKFWIANVTDRSGNPQPMLVLKERGGVFLDKQPTEILRETLLQSLRSANLLAPDADSADLVLRLYLFHFGLGEGSGLDFFGKVEFSTIVKNPKTAESQEVKASGTSIAKGAVRKKNIQKNVEEDIREALKDAVRNFLRGTQLKEAVGTLSKAGGASPTVTPSAAEPAKPPGM
jgi:hypothetical protein